MVRLIIKGAKIDLVETEPSTAFASFKVKQFKKVQILVASAIQLILVLFIGH